MSSFTIRRAENEDAASVADLWSTAAAQLKNIGTDQWQYPVRLDAIGEAIAAGKCWIIENRTGLAVGTVTIDEFADPRLWSDDDAPELACYVHRLVLAEDVRGKDLGSAILDWASERAKRAGKAWLRLDAWTTNTGLHRYYLDRGFRLVRRVQTPGVNSGVLFERNAGIVLGTGPCLCEV